MRGSHHAPAAAVVPNDDTRNVRPVAWAAIATAALLMTLWACLLLAATPAWASVARGLCVVELDRPFDDPAARTAAIAEVADRLNAGWVRLTVSWARLEPVQGQYDGAYLSHLDDTVRALRANGVDLLVTFLYAPRWASDSSYWDDPPPLHAVGYDPRYPVRADALDDMGATAQFLSTRYAGLVRAYECWNEPNLWPYLYPQRTPGDEDFAARTYLGYLKAFSAGVKRGDPAALVVAGSTAPVGNDDLWRTSPQKFAVFLARSEASAYFDVYSHHPYVPGGSRYLAPDQPPNSLSTTVTLYNLSQLLGLFPTKPFYLTEYGYNTNPSRDFANMSVSKVQQAAYLRTAYAYAARYPQVKNLFWYLVTDVQYGTRPEEGVYTGLRETTGTRKPSWFAFAGGNRLSIAAPRFARIGAALRVRGVLENREGGLRGQTLVLQSRRYHSGDPWRTLKETRTGSTGSYAFRVTPPSSRVYRVVWRGVKTSDTRTVRVY